MKYKSAHFLPTGPVVICRPGMKCLQFPPVPSCSLLSPPVPSYSLLFPPIPSCVTCYLPPLLCRPPWQSLHLSQTEDRRRNTTVRSDSPSAQDNHSTSGYLSQSTTYIIPRAEAFVLYHMIDFFLKNRKILYWGCDLLWFLLWFQPRVYKQLYYRRQSYTITLLLLSAAVYCFIYVLSGVTYIGIIEANCNH